MSDTLAVLVAFVTGLVVGGPVTILIDRIPDNTALSWRSRCPWCSHELSFSDTIPVLSWFRLSGKCRHCGDPITPAYPIVEMTTATVWAISAWIFAGSWLLLPMLVLVTALIALSMIDYYTYRLPTRLIHGSMAVSAVAMVIAAVGIGRSEAYEALLHAVVGAVVYSLFFLVLNLIYPRGMGMGDVRLARLLGMHMGWVTGATYFGWAPMAQLMLWALLVSCLLALVAGVSLGLARRYVSADLVADPLAVDGQPTSVLKQSLPFGPSLAAGTILAIWLMESIL